MKKIIVLILILMLFASIFISQKSYRYEILSFSNSKTVVEYEEPDGNEPIGGYYIY